MSEPIEGELVPPAPFSYRGRGYGHEDKERWTRQALNMKRMGASWAKIAETIDGPHLDTVRLWCLEWYRERAKDLDLDQALAEEQNRLDQLLWNAEPDLQHPDPKVRQMARDTILKVTQVRARLLGLEAPKQLDVNVTVETEQDRSLKEAIQAWEAQFGTSQNQQTTSHGSGS